MIILDEIERVARDAHQGRWGVYEVIHCNDYGENTGACLEVDGVDRDFIDRMSPAATLELVARIRELEATVARLTPLPHTGPHVDAPPIGPEDEERAAKVALVMMDDCDPDADTLSPGHKAWMNFRGEAKAWHAAILSQGYMPKSAVRELETQLAEADALVAARYHTSGEEWGETYRGKDPGILASDAAIARHRAREGK